MSSHLASISAGLASAPKDALNSPSGAVAPGPNTSFASALKSSRVAILSTLRASASALMNLGSIVSGQMTKSQFWPASARLVSR